jgi:site-specific recombinase XerD
MDITAELLESKRGDFAQYLVQKDRSSVTVHKYSQDIRQFIAYLRRIQCKKMTRQDIYDYKDYLISRYKITTVNSYIVSVNMYFSFLDRPELRLKTISIQRKTRFNSVLTDDEYTALIKTAGEMGKERLCLIIRTLASSGMRISDLRNITPAMLKTGSTFIRSRNKVREIILPDYICKELLAYCEKNRIEQVVFHGRKPDKPIDTALIWRDLKALARLSGVPEKKVFPNNFRHFFAEKYLSAYNDVIDLAEILGHSSIETTRIYTRARGQEKRDRINKLKI